MSLSIPLEIRDLKQKGIKTHVQGTDAHLGRGGNKRPETERD